MVVDCLLPGEVRKIGGRMIAYGPPRPRKLTAKDCEVYGGKYVAYDRANPQTALSVWLEEAKRGDPGAQANVGYLYEQSQDYAAAAEWYQKAAAANPPNTTALFALGTLYEQGLGVSQDLVKALNLYRQATGIKDPLGSQKVFDEQVELIRSQLQSQIGERDEQIKALGDQVRELEKRLQSQSADSAATKAQLQTLSGLLAKLQGERDGLATQQGKLPPCREPPCVRSPGDAGNAGRASTPVADPVVVRGLKLGRYFALVIGNQNYQRIESLKTPINDATRAAALLREKYGFTVTVLHDADEYAMAQAFNELYEQLKPEDNLLVYYAGHGSRMKAVQEIGYWLPVDSFPPPNNTFWFPTEQVTAQIGRLPARRVLIVADSCYAGLLSDEPSLRYSVDPGQVSLNYVRLKLDSRARLLISSGGDEPVLDEGGQDNSVFARAFLDVLEANQGVMSAAGLFVRVKERVQQSAARLGFKETPEFKAIKGAGHGIGDFFLVPVAAR